MKLRDQSNFKEMRYTESDWFSTFTLGHENLAVVTGLMKARKSYVEMKLMLNIISTDGVIEIQ